MKILVQNCQTHLYLKSIVEWIPDPADAKLFSTSEEAIRYCAQHRLPAVQIVLKFETAAYDIPIPITKECDQNSASAQFLPA